MLLYRYHQKTYEVIGNPPNIAVPTHFAKVVLAARPSSPSTPQVPEVSTGAFVLPNAVIPDGTPLESFVVPGKCHRHQLLSVNLWSERPSLPVDTVERAAGLALFSDAIKGGSKHICKTTKCELIVRHFDDAQKRPEMRRAISSPR
jgi:endonuclease G, mitochondrial